MINRRQIISTILALIMLLSLSTPTFAAAMSSNKEEVVYITTDSTGKPESINVVNIFGSGDITDFGDYSAVKMMTSNDEITQNGDAITFSTSSEKAYYQGTMNDVEIPWNISLRYFLDGKEYSATEIAGQTGNLEIRFSVSKNTKCQGTFYDDYALQATFLLDTDICKNISAEGATIANVGSNKQLSYTILPRKGVESIIKADVTDFKMDTISINGIKLNLNIEIDDSELMDRVSQLMEATKKLNEGSGELHSGTENLKNGSSALGDGITSLQSGVTELDDGVVALQNGISAMEAALDTLNSKSLDLKDGSSSIKSALSTIESNLNTVSVDSDDIIALTSASGEIKNGINSLYEGAALFIKNLGYDEYKAIMLQNGLDLAALRAGNEQAITDLSMQIESLNQTLASITGVPGYEDEAAQIEFQIVSLQNVITLLTGNNAAIDGTAAYLGELENAAFQIQNGAENLKNQYEVFDTKIGELANSLGDMIVGLNMLSNGVSELLNKYGEFDSGIAEYTDGVAALSTGYVQIMEGVSALAIGSKNLLSGAGQLSEGADELYDGITKYCDGIGELSSGTNELYTQTSDMDKQVENQIDDILSSIGGTETEAVSFASSKNTNVESVQFVIKIAGVEKAEVSINETTQTEPLNFWQKLLGLFGWN